MPACHVREATGDGARPWAPAVSIGHWKDPHKIGCSDLGDCIYIYILQRRRLRFHLTSAANVGLGSHRLFRAGPTRPGPRPATERVREIRPLGVVIRPDGMVWDALGRLPLLEVRNQKRKDRWNWHAKDIQIDDHICMSNIF